MRRGFAFASGLACLLFVLTGCGGADERGAFTDSRIPPALGPRFWAPEGWAWGLIGVGDAPVQRYGVSGPTITPKGNILVLAGYGESAEVWFETARDLNAAGYGVWVMERAGQGGSQRYVSPRDLGHAPDFADDIAATRTLSRMIVSGAPGTPLILLGHAEGGLIATAAIEDGGLPVDGLILSAPALKASAQPDWQGWLTKVGLGRVPASFDYGWRREPPVGGNPLTSDPQRGAVQKAWQLANPDLRMGGQSIGWKAAFRQTAGSTPARLKSVETPALLLIAGRDGDAGHLKQACSRMGGCTSRVFDGGRHALHLERDPLRRPWLEAIDSFTRTRALDRRVTQQTAPDHRL